LNDKRSKNEGGKELTKIHIFGGLAGGLLMGVAVGIVAGIVAGMVGGVMLKHTYDKYLQEPPLRRMIKSGYRKAFKRSSE